MDQLLKLLSLFHQNQPSYQGHLPVGFNAPVYNDLGQMYDPNQQYYPGSPWLDKTGQALKSLDSYASSNSQVPPLPVIPQPFLGHSLTIDPDLFNMLRSPGRII